MRFWALVATHSGVAACAWVNGWITGRLLARRVEDTDWQEPVPMCDLVDLAEPAPAYDWAVHGECRHSRKAVR